ncbi:sugar ABC transporter permease [Paenibacillus thalictri]|uniref:Sugar ABC transporter permease n=2 Tax=Paenibacillus thalictri TaxID=2527873 RepID=A0A4V2J350_9BACL|nr:sugar ABC transporter permease [Paenibacillus thalictri]
MVAAVWKRWRMDKYLYMMAFPGMFYFAIFHYLPMWGVAIAFQDYDPFQGVARSEWVGMEHFARLFRHPDFWLILRNTLVISFLNIVFFFPAPIVLALLLNEIRAALFKKTIQTVLYLPHFVSWVVICSLTIALMNSEGLITQLVHAIGYPKLQLLMDKSLFWGIVTVQSIWKDAGWGTILFLAALAGISPELYESAKVDGATRWQMMRYITIPCLMNTIVILLILRLGQVLNISFDQLYIMGNPLVKEVAEVFDTYVYQAGVLQGNFSYATAIGIFKSGVGFLLILVANYISKKTSEHYLF